MICRIRGINVGTVIHTHIGAAPYLWHGAPAFVTIPKVSKDHEDDYHQLLAFITSFVLPD